MLNRLIICSLSFSIAAASLPLHGQDVRKAEPISPAYAPGYASAAAPVPGAANPDAASATAPRAGIALRNGDTVDIRIAGVPPEDIQQFNGAYQVDESGMINLPYIGMVKASGLPTTQVQANIQSLLISAGIYTSPSISVSPQPTSRFISVEGAVKGPGRVPYSSDLTLMTAISYVGGFSDFAGDRIRLIRGGKIELYSRKKLTKDPSLDPKVNPGDRIDAQESWF